MSRMYSENTRCTFALRALPILLSLLFAFFPVVSSADQVSSSEALTAVKGWLRTHAQPLGTHIGRTIGAIEPISDATGKTVYHIVHLEPNGFVIVAADDSVEPIICFSAADKYDPGDGNPLWSIASADIAARIEQAQAVAAEPAASVTLFSTTTGTSDLQDAVTAARARWDLLTAQGSSVMTLMSVIDVSDLCVAPLVKSTWGQFTVGDYADGISCYNYYTPPFGQGDPDNYPCGCVATAMAQIVRYHQYPASYNWSAMPLVPDQNISLAQRQAIGGLCFDAAEAVDTVYGPLSSVGSQASLSSADAHMQSTLEYSNSIYSADPPVGAVLNNMMNANLDAGLPVLLGLYGPAGGHSVVCDGYGYDSTTLYHHLNMGWSGRYDLWYALPAVDSMYTFNTIDSCVYNILTSGSGEIVSGRVTDIVGNPLGGVNIQAAVASGPTYQTATNASGIYAFTGLPSNRSITLSAAKSPHVFTGKKVTTGRSVDRASLSGNVWAVNFTSAGLAPPVAHSRTVPVLAGRIATITLSATDEGLPDPPGRLSYVILSLPEHGILTDPSFGRIYGVPHTLADYASIVEYSSCPHFSGPDSFEFAADDGGAPPQAGMSPPAAITLEVNDIEYRTHASSANIAAPWPIDTGHHDSRTQVIYTADEIGPAGKITGLALDIHTLPAQTLNNWTIRVKHTDLAYYTGPAFETDGWTTVHNTHQTVSATGWAWFDFQTEFDYNGQDSLMIDFSYDNDTASTDSLCRVSDSNNVRVVMASSDSAHGDPLNWSPGTFVSIFISTAVPNIKLKVATSAVPMAGDVDRDCDVDIYDFAAFASAWLSKPGDLNWNPACDMSDAGEGFINEMDFAVLAEHWLDEQW